MNPIVIGVGLLLGSAALIYVACEFFVNGVEWVGRKFAIGQQATGSILAAIGTALPESVITFIAVAFGGTAAHKQIGVGAALGGPLVLATIAYAIVGLTLLMGRRKLPVGDATRREFKHLSHDQGWFLVIFAAKIGLGVIAFAWKPSLGVLFLAAYVAYFRKEMGAERGGDHELEPLRFMPGRTIPATWAVLTQTLLALVVIFAASRLFVDQLGTLGPSLGIEPQLLALLLSPIATELPETLNAVIWVRQGKYPLALANISGSMMIQATIPTALGLFFTPWLFDKSLILAATMTGAAVMVMYLAFRSGLISRKLLASMALFYALFAVLLVVLHLA